MVPMDSSAERFLDGLDDAQREAASSVRGAVRIIAVAGAGKTRTITRRIAYGVASGAWNPAKVLAVTFSVKAATEMKSRLATLGAGADVRASTFHSAALRQLRMVWPNLVDGPFPHVNERQDGTIGRAITRLTNISERSLNAAMVRDVREELNWCKVGLVAPSDYPRLVAAQHRLVPCGLTAAQFSELYDMYEQEKTARGEIDFNDILLLACHVLESFPEAAAAIRRQIGWLTVDEYQDVSPLQHRLMKLWLGGNDNVCVVGDPAQTIYSFAGATSYYLNHFGEEFGPLRADIRLERDYRSNPPVVRMANRVLRASDDRADYQPLKAVRDGAARVERTRYATDAEEAAGVAERIRRYVEHGGKASDCAILTRINAQQLPFTKALDALGIRYQLRRDSGWQRSALPEGLALQIPGEEEGAAAGADVAAGKTGGTGEATPGQKAGESPDGIAAVAETAEIAVVAAQGSAGSSQGVHEGTVPSAIPVSAVPSASSASSASSAPEGDTPDVRTESAGEVQKERDLSCVTISTIHAAKGLEFKQVYLIGCSEGLLPYRGPDAGEELEEERRLMYVGITRAEDKLHLSYAEHKGDGAGQQRAPSRFLL